MKKITFFVVALTTLSFAQAIAQSAQHHLNSAIESTESIRTSVVTSKTAVNQLTKEIAIIGNPNAVLFNTKMMDQINSVQNNVDDTDYYVNEAKNVSVIPFSSQPINALTADLINLNDELIRLTYQIEEALNNNNNTTALDLLPQVTAVLNAQDTRAIEVINTIQNLKQTIKVFNVCIQTVDYQGNPVPGDDLHGFWAQNLATGEYIYPTNQEGNCFENLPAGTYRFDSYNGYWSGTSSTDVTLSESLENSNGNIIVNLTYWSE
ncbi:hypothetical protein [Flavobacterium sp. GCM10027622]|uniref:hypothetical protein n=1 Tax=unclassified Flavobacterium TaxID=196869 RepID=UPI003619BE91